jgi:hypothetical protein
MQGNLIIWAITFFTVSMYPHLHLPGYSGNLQIIQQKEFCLLYNAYSCISQCHGIKYNSKKKVFIYIHIKNIIINRSNK